VILALPQITDLIGSTPDGHVVAMAHSTALVIDASNEHVIRRIPTTADPLRAAAMSPKRDAVLLASPNGIERIELSTGARSHLLPNETGAHALAYTPDGNHFAVASPESALRDALDGSLVTEATPSGSVDISSTGQVAWGAGRVHALDGRPAPPFATPRDSHKPTRFSPDGTHLAWIHRAPEWQTALVVSTTDPAVPTRVRWVKHPSRILWLNDTTLMVLEGIHQKRPSIWDLQTNEWRTGPGAQDAIARGPDRLLLLRRDGLKVWHATEPAHHIHAVHSAPVDHLVENYAQIDLLLSAARDGSVALLSRPDAMVHAQWTLHSGAMLRPLALRCTESEFVTAGQDGHVWHVPTTGGFPWLLTTHEEPVRHLTTVSGCLVAAATAREVVIIDLRTRRVVERRQTDDLIHSLERTVYPPAPVRMCGNAPRVERPHALRVHLGAEQPDPPMRARALLWTTEGWKDEAGAPRWTPRQRPLGQHHAYFVDPERSDTLLFSDRPALRVPDTQWTALRRESDGTVIAATATGQIVVVEPGTLPTPRSKPSHTFLKPQMRFMSQKRVALSPRDRSGVDVETGQPLAAPLGARSYEPRPLLSPGERYALRRSRLGQNWQIVSSGNDIVTRLDMPLYRPMWLDDSRILVIKDKQVVIIGLDGVIVSRIPLPDGLQRADPLAISSNRTRIAGADGRHVWTVSLDGTQQHVQSVRHGRQVEHISFSPDDRHLVVFRNGGRSTVYTAHDLTVVGRRNVSSETCSGLRMMTAFSSRRRGSGRPLWPARRSDRDAKGSSKPSHPNTCSCRPLTTR
jgi:WD40 repeat protein